MKRLEVADIAADRFTTDGSAKIETETLSVASMIASAVIGTNPRTKKYAAHGMMLPVDVMLMSVIAVTLGSSTCA